MQRQQRETGRQGTVGDSHWWEWTKEHCGDVVARQKGGGKSVIILWLTRK